MKNEKWLMTTIIVFTSITTFALLYDNTLWGFLRAISACIVLDGLVFYWDDKRTTLKNEKQRDWSGKMMWAGVGIMLALGVGYAIEAVAPVDATKTYDLLGFTFDLTIKQFILMLAGIGIGGWVVLTLAVILKMRGIDPDIQKDLEHTKALEERDRIELEAYKEALKVTAKQIGTEKAISLFKKHLKEDGYTDAEVNMMESEARVAIQKTQGGLTVGTEMQPYSADAQNTTANPTRPSTRQ